MTIFEARAISRTNQLHVRREAWAADKWMFWKGALTFIFPSAGNQPVRATDYSKDDLLATDWTTVPAALASCPVDPGTGSTGGGPPVPGVGGFPPDTTVFPKPPGSSGGGGSTSLPAPDAGTSIRVKFSMDNWPREIPPGHYDRGDINRTRGWTASSAGSNRWKLTINTGQKIEGGSVVAIIEWTLEITRGPSGYTISLTSEAGGFLGGPGSKNDTFVNVYTDGEINGGTAVLL